MPKIKTNRSAAKRFKKTSTGKFVFSKSNASHILTKKSSDSKRTFRRPGYLAESDVPRIKRALAI